MNDSAKKFDEFVVKVAALTPEESEAFARKYLSEELKVKFVGVSEAVIFESLAFHTPKALLGLIALGYEFAKWEAEQNG